MGFFDGLFNRKTNVSSASTLTGDQKNIMKNMSGFYNQRLGQNQDVINRLISGRPTTTINADMTRDYFRNAIQAPAERQLNERILPGIRQGMARNYWSTARQGAENQAVSDYGSQMNAALADLLYKDEQARRQLAEAAANRSLQTLGQFDPSQILTQLLGVKGKENIATQQPSLMDNLVSTTALMKSLIPSGR